jgi:hypothetical protein
MIARPWQLAAHVTLAVWAVLMLTVRRTDAITDDWQGWRQADTAQIARNLVDEEADPLRPRIAWRGDGPGYVETELQLYPAIVAAIAAATGDVVRPAQLVSLACVALACALIFAALARRFGDAAGYAGLLAALSMQGTIVASTTIQPDPLAFLAFTVGWLAFLADLAAPSSRALAGWIAATAIAGLVKPTALELGVAQFAVVALAHRAALRRPRLWLGWLAVLAIVGAYLLYARTLYTTYGNTFGVLSGGDSKLPAASALAAVEPWRELARFGVVWGVGFLALPAAALLAWRRRLGPEPIALAVAAALLSLVAFRYTASTFGTHYLLPHVVARRVAGRGRGRRAAPPADRRRRGRRRRARARRARAPLRHPPPAPARDHPRRAARRARRARHPRRRARARRGLQPAVAHREQLPGPAGVLAGARHRLGGAQ